MATRYWVGGSGNWTDISHWSATSGGAGGASVPTDRDDVVVDNSSTTADFSISWNGFAQCNSFDSRLCNYKINFLYLAGSAFYISLESRGNVYLNNVISNGSYRATIRSFNYLIGSATQTNLYQSGFVDGTVAIGSQITLQSDFTGDTVRNQLGSFISSGYSITVNSLSSTSNTGQIINITNSIVNIANSLDISSNATVIASGSTIIFGQFASINNKSNHNYNVIIAYNNGGNFQLTNTLNVRKLILAGGATKKTLNASTAGISFLDNNQILAAANLSVSNLTVTGAGSYYLGSNSTNNGSNSGVSFTDAPLVSSLVDNFPGTTLSTTNWISSSSSGGYATVSSNKLDVGGNSSSSQVSVISKSQYLLEGSSVTFRLSRSLGSGGYGQVDIANAYQQYSVSAGRNLPNISVQFNQTSIGLYIDGATSYSNSYTETSDVYVRVREQSGRIYLDTSSDGIVFTNRFMPLLSTYGIDSRQITARPAFRYLNNNSGYFTISQFNVPLEPVAEFTQNVTSGTTPLTVNFTDQSNFTPTSWSWNFGDSTTSTSQNPSKTYSTPGTYSVSLTSSNSSYTRSVTKTNLITVSPNVYSRSISGTLLFGGSVSRKLLASRSISGGLVFGGSVRAVVLRDVEGLQDKRYLYKVYDPDGNYIEVWKDVISELSFTNEINTIGSTTVIELARNSDSLGTTTSPLQTESYTDILTEDDQDILVSTTSRNQIGSGSSVDYNNRVDIIVFYGSVEPLLTEDDMEILSEDDEELLVDVGAPNGRRIFTGFISEINSRYGSTETTIVQLTSYGWDLDQFPITTSEGATTVPFNSFDPSQIARNAVDKFGVDSALYGTYTERSLASIQSTGTVVSYTFKANTYKEVLDKTLELMPSNWYYRIGLGDNIVYYAERKTSADHLFYLGKHIEALDLRGSILDSTNRVLFTGGGDPALYIDRSEVPANRTRRTLEVMSDSRVTLMASADIITEGRIDQNNKQLYRTSIEILTKQYDIETIDVGDTVGFRNFDNYVDGLVLQVVGLTYSPDTVQLQLETKPPTVSKRLEDIRRNLIVSDNENVPATPS